MEALYTIEVRFFGWNDNKVLFRTLSGRNVQNQMRTFKMELQDIVDLHYVHGHSLNEIQVKHPEYNHELFVIVGIADGDDFGLMLTETYIDTAAPNTYVLDNEQIVMPTMDPIEQEVLQPSYYERLAEEYGLGNY